MRIVVVGARGQLGCAVVHAAQARHEVVALDRSQLDISDAAAVAAKFRGLKPDVVINCAAYNAVDHAEDDATGAIRGNALAVRNLVRALDGATLVHYSTDFVFDGRADRPYVESDAPNPLGVYAMSKLMGEWFALDAPRSYVLRVESLFGQAPGAPPAKGSLAGIVDALVAGRVPKVFSDKTITPTYIVDCAAATLALLENGAATGLYHCVNSGACTWLTVAEEAARLLGVPPRFEAVRLADVPLRAARPQYSALANDKLAHAGAPMRPWQEALADYLRGVRPLVPVESPGASGASGAPVTMEQTRST